MNFVGLCNNPCNKSSKNKSSMKISQFIDFILKEIQRHSWTKTAAQGCLCTMVVMAICALIRVTSCRMFVRGPSANQARVLSLKHACTQIYNNSVSGIMGTTGLYNYSRPLSNVGFTKPCHFDVIYDTRYHVFI